MADDKAKIDWAMLEASAADPAPLEAAPAEASPADAAPLASPAGKIAFYCSNGHRIVVEASMAGQRGKCSKCRVSVRIPRSAKAASRPAKPQGRGTGEPSPAEPHAVDEVAPGTVPAEPPGGGWHAPDAAEPQSSGQPESREDMFSGLVTTGDSHMSATEFVELSHQLSHLSHHGEQTLPGAEPEPGRTEPASPPNPTAALVARLFQEMEHGGIVEVHITGGSVILPEFYEPRWSVGSHGLFASRAADGTVTLTAVAWDSIQKIIVRQVDGLPDGMFE